MSGTIPPLPNTPSWRGVLLKKAQGQLYLYLNLSVIYELKFDANGSYICAQDY